jgi:zinc D-Ala-D-Ala carboxypeptidase
VTRLTPHFTLAELTVTRTGLNNTPTPAARANLQLLAERLERVRSMLQAPMTINSAYRSPAVNKAVGGAPTSGHKLGYAADFVCPAFGTPLEICRFLASSALDFDQLIEEGTWVHISFDPRRRRQVLTKRPGQDYRLGLGG